MEESVVIINTHHLGSTLVELAVRDISKEHNGRFISEDPAKDGVNWYIYCNNNPLKYVDHTGLVRELTAAWFSSTWWLCGIDGLLPVGNLIYFGTGILIGAGETIITYGDKITRHLSVGS